MQDQNSAILDRIEWPLDKVARYVRKSSGRYYAILDSMEEPRVWAKVDELGFDGALSLYNGIPAKKLRHVAPYLIRVDEDALEWIREELWDNTWGILVESTAEMRVLRRHLHDLLTVQDMSGERINFRFYDPRILPKFLEACDASELAEFFRLPVRYLIDIGGGQMAGYQAGPGLEAAIAASAP